MKWRMAVEKTLVYLGFSSGPPSTIKIPIGFDIPIAFLVTQLKFSNSSIISKSNDVDEECFSDQMAASGGLEYLCNRFLIPTTIFFTCNASRY